MRPPIVNLKFYVRRYRGGLLTCQLVSPPPPPHPHPHIYIVWARRSIRVTLHQNHAMVLSENVWIKYRMSTLNLNTVKTKWVAAEERTKNIVCKIDSMWYWIPLKSVNRPKPTAASYINRSYSTNCPPEVTHAKWWNN